MSPINKNLNLRPAKSLIFDQLTSTAIFGWIKWLGAAYLIWLGIKQWWAKSPSAEAHRLASAEF